jgi:hypothetical protein
LGVVYLPYQNNTKTIDMTKQAAKLEIAQANRELIISNIQNILTKANSYMTLKTAMEVFLSVNVAAKVGTKRFEQDFMSSGYSKVTQAAYKAVKSNFTGNPFQSEAFLRQAPSSMRA